MKLRLDTGGHVHVRELSGVSFIIKVSNTELFEILILVHFSDNWHKKGKLPVGAGADKSLGRNNSRCRKTQSVVSVESGVCSCAQLEVFSCYTGSKEAYQMMCAISGTLRRELSPVFFLARQGTEENSRHSDRNVRGTCTIVVCHRQKLGGPL